MSRTTPDTCHGQCEQEPDLGDDALVAQARDGDQEAFAVLVRRYEGAVAATVVGMLGPGGDADDVGQEVFLRFWRSLPRYRGDASLKTYLTRIAINQSINALRKRRRLLDRFLSRDRGEHEAPLLEPATPGERLIGAREAQQIVHAGLRRLPAERRSVVVLRMIQGYSTRETAEMLGIRPGTVMSRLHRAMGRLEEILRPYVEEHDD